MAREPCISYNAQSLKFYYKRAYTVYIALSDPGLQGTFPLLDFGSSYDQFILLQRRTRYPDDKQFANCRRGWSRNALNLPPSPSAPHCFSRESRIAHKAKDPPVISTLHNNNDSRDNGSYILGGKSVSRGPSMAQVTRARVHAHTHARARAHAISVRNYYQARAPATRNSVVFLP